MSESVVRSRIVALSRVVARRGPFSYIPVPGSPMKGKPPQVPSGSDALALVSRQGNSDTEAL